MTTTQGAHGAIPSFDKVKMEERKRSLVLDVDELAPSRKRLVKDENGQAMRMDAEKEKDVEVRNLADVPCYPWPLTLTHAAELPKGCIAPANERIQATAKGL